MERRQWPFQLLQDSHYFFPENGTATMCGWLNPVLLLKAVLTSSVSVSISIASSCNGSLQKFHQCSRSNGCSDRFSHGSLTYTASLILDWNHYDTGIMSIYYLFYGSAWFQTQEVSQMLVLHSQHIKKEPRGQSLQSRLRDTWSRLLNKELSREKYQRKRIWKR